MHAAMHLVHADELDGLPVWRRELAVPTHTLRAWHDRNLPHRDRAARRLAMALRTYTDAEQVPRAIIECDVPRALDAESYR
jgi:hypothetical protein